MNQFVFGQGFVPDPTLEVPYVAPQTPLLAEEGNTPRLSTRCLQCPFSLALYASSYGKHNRHFPNSKKGSHAPDMESLLDNIHYPVNDKQNIGLDVVVMQNAMYCMGR